MDGFYKKIALRTGVPSPNWDNVTAMAANLDRAVEAGQAACGLGAEKCRMIGDLVSFSLVQMTIDGKVFDGGATMEAYCATECPNQANLMTTLGLAINPDSDCLVEMGPACN